MKLRLLILTLFVTVLLSGCEEHEYTINLKYDGDNVIRKVVCSENMPADVHAKLKNLYPKQIDANSYEGTFGENLPDDVGGFGRHFHITNPMGQALLYVERFQGKDAQAIDVQKSLRAADRLTDMVIDWLEFELGKEPGFARLKKFCDIQLREDIKNLALYFWMGQRLNQSEVDESGVRILLYLYERGYFTIDKLSDIAVSTDVWGGALSFARGLITDKIGGSESIKDIKRFAFLKEVKALHQSASRFVASLKKQGKIYS